MHLQIIAVGYKMPTWVNAGFQEYAKRFIRPYDLSLKEISPAKRNSDSFAEIQKYQLQEAGSIEKILNSQKPWIALEVTGKMLSTEALAQKLNGYTQITSDLSFVIGGPDGFDKTFLSKATEQWSLSALTLPHPLVRIIVAEQLYRAVSILKNHPYHRGG
jgi:23S rRNA (pseudouridine1915-N3)-methyltransferase